MADHRFILHTISQHQPITRSDLFRICNLGIKREAFGYIMRTLSKKGLIHSAGKNGPVWLTIKGQEQRGWSPAEAAEWGAELGLLEPVVWGEW